MTWRERGERVSALTRRGNVIEGVVVIRSGGTVWIDTGDHTVPTPALADTVMPLSAEDQARPPGG